MSKFTIFLLLVLICWPTMQVNGQGGLVYPEYTIQPGDSLGYISTLFGTTVEEITRINNISNPDLVSPGQVIKIPSFQGYEGKLELVTSDLGESFSMLPIKYRTDAQSLIKINNLLAPSQIYVGSRLIMLLPEDSSLVNPVAKMESAVSLLETAAEKDFNPYTFSLVNQQPNLNLFMPEDVLFAPIPADNAALDLYAPVLQDVQLYPLPLVQGGTAVVAINSNQAVKLTGTIGEYPLTFFSPSPGEYYALQGIHALAKPGLVNFSLNVTSEDGRINSYTQQVLITPGVFDEDPALTVDPATIDPSVTEPENELVSELISQKTPTRYWSGAFSSPAYYQEYNSLFGTRRRYNDDPKIYFHTGVDFAGGLTLPITAPAPGQVVFAGPLTVRGNAVFIDHGWGVFSGFFHQDTLKVKVGDMVESGQQIGTVGNTGRVNGAGDYYGAGAHLHWEIWVNGVQVDPLDWLYRDYP